MNRVELLSPAKNFECAIAAINSGADAIYIGASDFGARVNASNSLETIENIVKYAHKFYVRVHVTINTILNDTELLSAIKLVEILYNIGVDAIIVQDMGLIKAAIDGKLPPIQIHASTQCDNRTLEKAKFFDDIGLSRIILARESSIDFIKSVCDSVSCEVETFIHGALCVSYSGQCYLSFANGGRSANRGNCAQPCRKKYSLVNSKGEYILNDKYLLSLKDLNLAESIEKLINAGVKSFKIEGRLKDVNYVTNITNFYNNLINKYAKRTSSGVVITDFKPNPNKSFNRLFTSYFLHSRNDCYNFLSPKSMGEYIGKVIKVSQNYIEIEGFASSQDGLIYEDNGNLCGFLVNKAIKNRIYPNKKVDIGVGTLLYRNLDYEFNKKLENISIVRKIRANITIENNFIFAQDEDFNKISIPLPEGEIPKNPEKQKTLYISQFSKSGDTDFLVENVHILSDNVPFLPISRLNELRRTILDKLMEERLKNYPKLLQKPLKYTNYYKKIIDYRGNVYNTEAENFYNNCDCTVEQRALESFEKVPSGIELMRTKHCLRYAANCCSKNCKMVDNLYLEDEYGKKYPLKFDCKNCEMVILSP